MSISAVPDLFLQLQSNECICINDIVNTKDGFWMACKSLSEILAQKGILDFPDAGGKRLACDKFFDDWFLYAVPNESDYIYSLLKLREQEHDTEYESPADGDTPGITISFISLDYETLLSCLAVPTDKNRQKLDCEIERVVAKRGQRHHKALKKYFKDPQSQGSYLVADIYIKMIASYAENGYIEVPDFYKEIVKRSLLYKNSSKLTRLPHFIESLNEKACNLICDHERIFIKNKSCLDEYEYLAILATHTGNTSVYSFAAEVEYHARFLTMLAKIKLPFLGRSFYDSAIRADMTVGDNEFEGPAPFYKPDSEIVKRQYKIHQDNVFVKDMEQ